MMPVIRLAEVKDLPALQQIEQSSFATDRLSLRQMQYHLRNSKALFLTADISGRAVGYVLVLCPTGTAARIYSLAVATGFRGQGISKQLCKVALDIVKAKGFKNIGLEVDENDRNTIALYTALGFADAQYIPAYYADGRTALKMKKALHD